MAHAPSKNNFVSLHECFLDGSRLTLVFMFWENSRMVSTLVQASGCSFKCVSTSCAILCCNTDKNDTLDSSVRRHEETNMLQNMTSVTVVLMCYTHIDSIVCVSWSSEHFHNVPVVPPHDIDSWQHYPAGWYPVSGWSPAAAVLHGLLTLS